MATKNLAAQPAPDAIDKALHELEGFAIELEARREYTAEAAIRAKVAAARAKLAEERAAGDALRDHLIYALNGATQHPGAEAALAAYRAARATSEEAQA